MSIDHQECIQADIDEIDLIIEGMEDRAKQAPPTVENFWQPNVVGIGGVGNIVLAKYIDYEKTY